MKVGMPSVLSQGVIAVYKGGGRAVHHHNGPPARKRGKLGKKKAR
jgi:hypothetical protein